MFLQCLSSCERPPVVGLLYGVVPVQEQLVGLLLHRPDEPRLVAFQPHQQSVSVDDRPPSPVNYVAWYLDGYGWWSSSASSLQVVRLLSPNCCHQSLGRHLHQLQRQKDVAPRQQ